MNIHPTYHDDPELPFGNKLKNADGFKVPVHYFERNEEMILMQCTGLGSHDSNEKLGFDVPKGYFDHFADALMERIASESLAFIPKSDSFKVPENYFETFPDRLQEKISKERSTPALKIVKHRKLWYYVAAACLVTVVGLFSLRWMESENSVNILADCSEEELLEYVTVYADEFDQQSLAALLEETDLESVDVMDEWDVSTEEMLIEYLE